MGVVLPIIHWLTVGRGAADYSLVNSSQDVPLAYTAEPFATRTVYSKWPNNLIEIHQDGCSYQPPYAPEARELKLEAAWCHIWSFNTTPCLPAPPPHTSVGGAISSAVFSAQRIGVMMSWYRVPQRTASTHTSQPQALTITTVLTTRVMPSRTRPTTKMSKMNSMESGLNSW